MQHRHVELVVLAVDNASRDAEREVRQRLSPVPSHSCSLLPTNQVRRVGCPRPVRSSTCGLIGFSSNRSTALAIGSCSCSFGKRLRKRPQPRATADLLGDLDALAVRSLRVSLALPTRIRPLPPTSPSLTPTPPSASVRLPQTGGGPHGSGAARPTGTGDRGAPRGGPVQGRAGADLAAARRDRGRGGQAGPQLLRQQLPGPVGPPGADRLGQGGARPVGVRHVLGPVHLRHSGGAPRPGAGPERVPAHRGHDPVLVLLRRQRRAVRDAPRPRGRGDQRRAQPRQHHRRDPPV